MTNLEQAALDYLTMLESDESLTEEQVLPLCGRKDTGSQKAKRKK